jgi:integrase
MKTKSSRSITAIKVKKPRPDFPLTPHPSGRWCKKVRGKLHYFGKLDDPQAALNKWLDQRDDLLAGRTPRSNGDGLTLRDLANNFLTAKQNLVDTQELSQRTFDDYHATCERLIKTFGKTRLVSDLASDDFNSLRASLGKTWGPVSVGNEINRIRVVFKYAFDAGLIEKPVRYGPIFKRPSKKTLRVDKASRGIRLFDVDLLRTCIEAADSHLKAMVLLGINCGLGNSDCGKLRLNHLNLATGWLDFPRPKTAVERRAKLWTETILALRSSIADRPPATHEDDNDLVFITKYGKPWAKSGKSNPISVEFRKLLASLKLYRQGLNFYALRHTFETIAGGCRDQVAVNHIMGHADASMAGVYRERIDDDRLVAVTEHVHNWLFGTKKVQPHAAKRTAASKKPRKAAKKVGAIA